MEKVFEPRWDKISDIKDTSVTIVVSSKQSDSDQIYSLGVRRNSQDSTPRNIGNLEAGAYREEFIVDKLKPNQEYIVGYYDENNQFIDASRISDKNNFITAPVIKEEAPILSDLQLRHFENDDSTLLGNIDYRTALSININYSVYNETYELVNDNTFSLAIDQDDYRIDNFLINYSQQEVSYLEMSYSYIDSLGNQSDILTDYQSIDTDILLPGSVEKLKEEVIVPTPSSGSYIELSTLQIGLIAFTSITFLILVFTRIFRNKLINRLFGD